ncbi:DUF3617 family protein [Filomicrobium sp.]|uniref:DUF3617 domain-containing protein n=1 Tax=Filomicrobium sp. TaxID=2024831 RepID=UPI00258E5566|nr:DUF3617 family protein [Filomicrobium sp.]
MKTRYKLVQSVFWMTLILEAFLFGPACALDLGLASGSYDVTVRLELPHLDTGAATKVTRLCVEAAGENLTLGLGVLSDNNPLAKCPHTKINSSDSGALRFDIVCPGTNRGQASATFDLRGDRFEGRITMKMGGKNMTMTEVQSGHRVGPCPAAAQELSK